MSQLLLNRVRTFFQPLNLPRHAPLLVAVSGGPDSLCLLHLLCRWRDAGGPPLHVAHLDHGLRGAESAAEAQFVADTAQAWGVATTAERIDGTRAFATHNVQDAARRTRYATLARVAGQVGASAVALAHHADDQAETVLLHLLRGTGLAGLRGMRPQLPWEEWMQFGERRWQLAVRSSQLGQKDAAETVNCQPLTANWSPPLLRPLLTTTRAEIEAYCAEQGLQPQFDSSNTSTHYTRNRIRLELLPQLQGYNPQIVETLGRLAASSATDFAFMQEQLDQHWPGLAETRNGTLLFWREAWERLHPALQRHAMRRALQLLDGEAELSQAHLENTLHALRQGSTRVELGPRLVVQAWPDRLLICSIALEATSDGRDDLPVPQFHGDDVAVVCPGDTDLGQGWQLRTRTARPASASPPWWVALDADRLEGALHLRRRRPGERFRPAGGAGSRSLQDFFVDQKVPRSYRGGWPILADGRGVVWLAGLRADARCVATDTSPRPLWVGMVREA
jgi:tRNA(Ile)-lysidine synthase